MLLSFLFENQYFHIRVLFQCTFFFLLLLSVGFSLAVHTFLNSTCKTSILIPEHPQTPATDPPSAPSVAGQNIWKQHLKLPLTKQMSLTAEYQLFLSFFGFLFSSKNISNALIMKKKTYIHIYIITAVREYLIPQRFCPELCPNWWTNKGEFFLWDTKCGGSAQLGLLLSARAGRLCSSCLPFTVWVCVKGRAREIRLVWIPLAYKRHLLSCAMPNLFQSYPLFIFVTGDQRNV